MKTKSSVLSLFMLSYLLTMFTHPREKKNMNTGLKRKLSRSHSWFLQQPLLELQFHKHAAWGNPLNFSTVAPAAQIYLLAVRVQRSFCHCTTFIFPARPPRGAASKHRLDHLIKGLPFWLQPCVALQLELEYSPTCMHTENSLLLARTHWQPTQHVNVFV